MPRTVDATAAGTFAMIDMIGFRSSVIKICKEHVRTQYVQLNEIAYSGNQVDEEAVG
jgi:hypothetical protein